MASDTSLVFSVLAKENVSRALNAVRNAFTSAGQQAEQSMSKASRDTSRLDAEIERVESQLAQLNRQFAATGDKTLFANIARDRSLLNQLRQVRKNLDDTDSSNRRAAGSSITLSGAMQAIGGGAGAAGGALQNAFSSTASFASSLWGLVAVLGAATVAFSLAGPAAYALGGAIGALPAIVAGAAAAIGTLKLGFFGLSSEYNRLTKAAGGGGGGGGGAKKAIEDLTPKLRAVEAAQREVKRSTRELAEAQLEARRAQLAINEAREEAVERMEDLNRSLKSAHLDEREAVLAVAEAEVELKTARDKGVPDEIAAAEIAYERAKLAVEDVQDRVGDLTKEQKENAAKGVDGSDEVVAAREREREAIIRVRDAEEQRTLAVQRLADAQRDLRKKQEDFGGGGGGGGGVAEQVTKLAPAARDFLNTVISLRPAFERLRLDVQQQLFSGLSDKLRVLASKWMPQLHVTLGRMATTFNGIFKTLFDTLSKTSVIRNFSVGIDAVRHAIGSVGSAIAGPLVEAFGRLAAASAPFIRMVGDRIGELIRSFADWIEGLDRSGALDSFFQRAGEIFTDIIDIFEDLASIAGSVMKIIFGVEGESQYSTWDTLYVAIDKVAQWFKNPENQQKIKDFMLDLENAFNKVGEFAVTASEWVSRLDEWGGKFTRAKDAVVSFLDGVKNKVLSWAAAIFGVPRTVAQALSSLPGVVSRAVSNAIEWLRTMGSRAFNSVRNVGQNVVNGIGDLGARLWNSGQNAVRGLWNGIASMGGWLWNKVYNFAGNILNAVTSRLNIGSPSKAMADEVGRWIPPGIAAGMDSTAGVVTDAANRISDSLLNTTMATPTVSGPQLIPMGQSSQGAGANGRGNVITVDVRGGDEELKRMIRKWFRIGELNVA